MNTRLLPTLLLLLFVSIMVTTAGMGEVRTNQDTQVLKPVYRIPLNVHLGGSARPTEEWIPILEEINSIWLSQAGICFEIRTVSHDERAAQGFDLWFDETLPDWNGYFRDENDMHVRDNPDLRPARRTAKSSAARTAAHELGHALRVSHRQDSDDNLMRSKTYGMQLHADEVQAARLHARKFALPDTGPNRCGPIRTLNTRQAAWAGQ
jgi:hypothetical protein